MCPELNYGKICAAPELCYGKICAALTKSGAVLWEDLCSSDCVRSSHVSPTLVWQQPAVWAVAAPSSNEADTSVTQSGDMVAN